MAVSSGRSQTATDLNEGLSITRDATTGDFTLSWWGKAGYSYFVEQSSDLSNWDWAPIAEQVQVDGVVSYGLSTNADRLFLRVTFTNDPNSPLLTSDFDGDHLSNGDELSAGLNPIIAEDPVDTDSDGMPDYWENFYFGDLTTGDIDSDGDELLNSQEFTHATNPLQTDTDSDGMWDGWEVTHGLDPVWTDESADDEDSDQVDNLTEFNNRDFWTDPTSSGIYSGSSDPNHPDSDGDTYTDKEEFDANTNPTDPSDTPPDMALVGNYLDILWYGYGANAAWAYDIDPGSPTGYRSLIQESGGVTSWTVGGRSLVAIPEDLIDKNGGTRFKFPNSAKTRMGLKAYEVPSLTYTNADITYAFEMTGDLGGGFGGVQVMVNGVSPDSVTHLYAYGTDLEIVRINGRIHFLINGSIVYSTDAGESTGDLMVQASFSDPGAAVINCEIATGTARGHVDADQDALEDGWENQYGDLESFGDPDGDGVVNLDEYFFTLLGLTEATDPTTWDLDLYADYDSDGVLNYQDAAPFDNSVGLFTIEITSPTEGEQLQN
ncbi:MAG: hypothetical protein AAGA96_04135 [Verrucomicrobiota bacterium]